MKALFAFLFLVSLKAFSASPVPYLPPEEMERRLRMLDYNPNFKIVKMEKYREKRDLEIFLIKLESINPVNHSPLITEFFWYHSKLTRPGSPQPLIILSPPIVGVDPAEKLIAEAFTRNPPYYNTFILKYDEKINDKNRPLSALSDSFKKSITQGRILIDFAETQSTLINSKKIGCYGMSLGGVMSVLLAEVDSRIKAAVVIVGGGNFAEIIAYSKQGIVKGYREARMKAEGIKTTDQLIQKMRDNFLFDPLFFAPKVATRNIYQVIGLDDTAVPTKNQLELWKALGEPQSRQYDAEHFPTILKNAPNHQPIMEFLRWRLSLEK